MISAIVGCSIAWLGGFIVGRYIFPVKLHRACKHREALRSIAPELAAIAASRDYMDGRKDMLNHLIGVAARCPEDYVTLQYMEDLR